MVCAEVTLRNTLGLHLRPAGLFCTEALKYTSSILIKYEDMIVNGKSVLGVLSAGLRYKSKFMIICEGSDEKEALSHLVELVEHGIGEETSKSLLES